MRFILAHSFDFYVAYLFLAQEISDFCVECDFMRQNLLHMTHHAHYNKGNLRHASYLNINMTYGAYYNKRPKQYNLFKTS